MTEEQVMSGMLQLIEQKVVDLELKQKLLDKMLSKHVKFVLAELDKCEINNFDKNQQNLIKEAFYLWG